MVVLGRGGAGRKPSRHPPNFAEPASQDVEHSPQIQPDCRCRLALSLTETWVRQDDVVRPCRIASHLSHNNAAIGLGLAPFLPCLALGSASASCSQTMIGSAAAVRWIGVDPESANCELGIARGGRRDAQGHFGARIRLAQTKIRVEQQVGSMIFVSTLLLWQPPSARQRLSCSQTGWAPKSIVKHANGPCQVCPVSVTTHPGRMRDDWEHWCKNMVHEVRRAVATDGIPPMCSRGHSGSTYTVLGILYCLDIGMMHTKTV